jgi:hypothetical protein
VVCGSLVPGYASTQVACIACSLKLIQFPAVMAASSSGEKRGTDAPALARDRKVRLRKGTDADDLIAELNSPACALEALVLKAYHKLPQEVRELLTIAVGGSKSLKSFNCTDYTSSMIDEDKLWELLKSNEVLESLDIEGYYFPRTSWLTSQSLCDMLRENTKLSSLRLPHDGWTVSELKELSGVLSRDAATGLQANETLKTLLLFVADSEQAEVVANMLRTNRTIRELAINSFPLESNDIVQILLEALEGNNVLRLLDLSRCYVPEEQEVFDTILNRLQNNPWLHLDLRGTPLSRRLRFSIIQQKLDENALLFKSWNPSLVKSNGARLFLCGSPRAGKCSSHLIQVLCDAQV